MNWLWRLTRLRLAYGPGEVTLRRDILYRPGSDHPKHHLDVVMPAGASGVPVVHFIHGGYWVGGDRRYQYLLTGLYHSIGIALAKRGIGTVIQSYRSARDVGIDGLVDDVLAALRWTEEHVAELGGDPARLFVMGHSAGGHVAALIASDDSLHHARGMSPDQVRGTIALSAVWDIADMHATHSDRFNREHTFPVFGRDPTVYPRHSPAHHLGPATRPLLILVGERDYPYLIPQARAAADKLRAAGNPAASDVIAGNDHAAMVLRFGAKDDNLTDRVVAFIGAREMAQRTSERRSFERGVK